VNHFVLQELLHGIRLSLPNDECFVVDVILCPRFGGIARGHCLDDVPVVKHCRRAQVRDQYHSSAKVDYSAASTAQLNCQLQLPAAGSRCNWAHRLDKTLLQNTIQKVYHNSSRCLTSSRAPRASLSTPESSSASAHASTLLVSCTACS